MNINFESTLSHEKINQAANGFQNLENAILKSLIDIESAGILRLQTKDIAFNIGFTTPIVA